MQIEFNSLVLATVGLQGRRKSDHAPHRSPQIGSYLLGRSLGRNVYFGLCQYLYDDDTLLIASL